MSRKSQRNGASKAPATKTFTLLTATGARPEAWAICEKLMARQDYAGPVRWVIVDDGAEAQPITFQREGWTIEVIRPEPFWQPGQNTQARNLKAGLEHIGANESVAFIEDDDYYASGYLSAVAEWLKGAELAGEGGARYYNVATRVWHDFGTKSPHASLCSTAVRGPALATLRKVLAEDDKFIDMRLWRDFRGRKALHAPAHVVGIKGMPGRGGIGVGHRMNGQPDPRGEKLAEWLGGDAALYQKSAPAADTGGLDAFVRQFSDYAVGSMPAPVRGIVARPIAFVGRDRAAGKPGVHVFGTGLAGLHTNPFVVASIYADTPEDAAHALALGQALEQLNVRFFLAKAEGRQSWEEDGALKASYLHNVWKESEVPVAWLDIETPPEVLAGWFASINGDFAVHNRSWEGGLQTGGSMDLSSSAMWFAKSDLAGQLLAEWEQRCQADSATPDATHLAAAWFDISARLPLRTVWLPGTRPSAPELLQLLTPTGCRPDTFALCARWMARQTWTGAVRWIIVDDGEIAQPLPEMPPNWELVVIRPTPFWREGDRTQPRNFLAGLDAARQDAPVIVIEDDDWYAPDYLAVTAQRLKQYSMVAVGPQRWANVKLMTCGEYSGLQWPWSSQLAFRPEAIAHVRHITATRDSYIDRDTWNEWQGSKQLFRDGRVVGIKGLPGRGGYMSVHHRAEGRPDPGLQQLEQWIGAEVAIYRDPVQASQPASSSPSPAPSVLQVLTTTGCRPEAMKLCARWMARQTWKGRVRWIIVDDGAEQQPLPDMPENWELHVVRPEPFWREGDHTQARNFVAGLDAAIDAPLIVVEDDDWYAADYLETVAQRLREYSMVAAGPQRWVNVRLRTCWEHSQAWPMMSQMAFRPEAFAHARNIAANQRYMLDRDIWNRWTGSRQMFLDGRSIAIKGMPGRGGYMNAHRDIMGSMDPELQQLRQWIGNDAEAYTGFGDASLDDAWPFVQQFRDPAVGAVPQSDPPTQIEESLQYIGYLGTGPETGRKPMFVFGTGLVSVGKRPFVVASIHGNNPQDTARAAALSQALDRLGITYFIAKDESNDSWQESGGVKAGFIQNLWKESDVPVVWLDINTAIRSFPMWFSSVEADFAAPCKATTGPRGKVLSLCGGALWFNKSPLARELLDEWVQQCQEEAGLSDDSNLASAWQKLNLRSPLRTVWLPPEYSATDVSPVAAPSSGSSSAKQKISSMQQLALRLVTGKHGLEIGGPSRRFSSGQLLPVYPVVASCDCTNFQAETLWERGLGKDFAPEGRKLGSRISAEMTDLKAADASYDFLLSSHALEHSANPLKALKESFRVLKPGGTMILILPERAATFDHRRPITKFEHLLEDERNDVGEDDMTHYEEIMALHDLARDKPAGTIEQFRARSLKNLENRGLHQHVFDTDLARRVVEYSGFEVLDAGHMSPMDIVVIAKKPEAPAARSDGGSFVVASIIGDNPRDAARAAAISQDLEQRGIRFSIARTDGRESWAGDTALKIGYIHDLWRSCGTPVLWLDIHGNLLGLPEWLVAPNPDFAIRKEALESSGLDAKALGFDTDVIWFGQSEQTSELLTRWQEVCKSAPALTEAESLAQAWLDVTQKKPLRTMWLPAGTTPVVQPAPAAAPAMPAPARSDESTRVQNPAPFFPTVESFVAQVEARIEAGRLGEALKMLGNFVWVCTHDRRALGKVLGDRRLDSLCQRIGAIRLEQLRAAGKLENAPQESVDCVVLATELYRTGGHTAVIQDLVEQGLLGEKVVLMLTQLLHGTDPSILDERFGDSVVRETARRDADLLDKLDWVLIRLSELKPRRLLLMNHHEDSVIIAAAQPALAAQTVFYHHADFQLCLGVMLEHTLHVDPTPAGYFNCRDRLGVSSTTYWPLSAQDRGPRKTGSWMKDGRLRTCSSGNASKFETPYKFPYAELIPHVMQRTGGVHVHNGPLSGTTLKRIRSGLSSLGIPHERFVHVPWVPSVWELLHSQEIDVVLGSFPAGGGRLTIEAMGAGIPIIGHQAHLSIFHGGQDLYYPGAFLWNEPAELLNHITRLTPERLAAESQQARRHFEEFHAKDAVRRAVHGNGATPLPLRPCPGDPLQSLLDDFAHAASDQSKFQNRMKRMGVVKPGP